MEDDHDPRITDVQKFFINGCGVDVRAGSIECSDGPQHLEPRVMNLLVALVAGKGEVVTRDELIDTVWNGAAGADQSLNQAVSRLRSVLEESPLERALIETVPKRGYRLIADIALPQPDKSAEDAQANRGIWKLQGVGRLGWLALAAAALSAVILAVIYWLPGAGTGSHPPSDVSGRSILAVLPFVNTSSNPEQEFFSDGMTDEILNVLAKVPGIRVTSRTSVFSLKGEKFDIPAIAERLGVSHVVEGSVRQAGGRIRITAQFIDAGSDTRLWSETYDRELTTKNIFAIQEDIARQIAAALKISLGLDGQQLVGSKMENLEAYNSYLRARALYHQRQDFPEIMRLLRQVVTAEPNFAPGWAALSHAAKTAYIYWPAEQRTPELRATFKAEGEQAALRAVALAPDSSTALHALAEVQDFADGAKTFERALALDPYAAEIMENYVSLLLEMGLVRQAHEMAEKMVALDPIPINQLIMGLAYTNLGRFDEAQQISARILTLDPAFGPAFWFGTDIYLLDNDMEGLEDHIALMTKNRPDLAALYKPAFDALSRVTAEGAPPSEEDWQALAIRWRLIMAVRLGDWDRTEEYFRAIMDSDGILSVSWIMTNPEFADLRRLDGFRKRLAEDGHVEFWRSHGWPDHCRPKGEDDFECDWNE